MAKRFLREKWPGYAAGMLQFAARVAIILVVTVVGGGLGLAIPDAVIEVLAGPMNIYARVAVAVLLGVLIAFAAGIWAASRVGAGVQKAGSRWEQTALAAALVAVALGFFLLSALA